ncbi:hypothetical protein FOE78_06310 [Microlunatus elymi]|uniref:ABC-2 type transport system permease protein n=1 Tax=Microlunatus elymi TaxID=2596828 RepID=A0A516PWQ1_9ACTN|nr:hypothetical protein [Microlunatus elymi]QDP95572.1 hypothetical protein FOE78_06310 [Microlunatus elymi]
MVAVIVGLKLSLLRNGLRRSTWRLVAMIIGLVYGAAIVAGAWAGLIALRFAPSWLAADLTTVGFSLLTVGWLLMSLLAFGADETVDPSRFALLPVSAQRLQPGLFLAGLIGVPGLATALIGLGSVVTWARSPGLIIVAVISVPFGVASCFLIARVATTAFAQALSSRRFRDFAAVVMALFGAGVALSINAITRASSDFSPAALRAMLQHTAAALGWTPFGWSWSAPAELATGSWPAAMIKLLLSAALIILLWYGWQRFLVRSLTSPLEVGGTTRRAAHGSFIDRLYPATRAGAVAARSLRYWRRDPRYLAAISGICVAPLIIIVTQLINPHSGSATVAMFAPTLLSLLIGSVVTSDISYDGTALWTHVSTGIRGADDRAGRAMAVGTVIGPIALIMTVVVAVLGHKEALLPQVLALVIGLGMIAIGVGCWAGTVWQVPVPPPGSNPFQRGNSGGLAALASTGATVGLTAACALPTIAVVIGSFWIGWLAYVGIAVGVVSGIVALRLGIGLGGARLDRHWPEVLARVGANS